jgi:nucleotide-binding universal stress UspA family protein
MNGTVLVATDGTPQSLGALRVARRLEERDGRKIIAATVVEPVPVYDTGFMVALPEAELFEARKGSIETEIRLQMETVTGSPTGWPLRVEPGIPASRVVSLAEELGASLIVVGVGEHGPMERIFGRETALQIIRLSHLPVLAVPGTDLGLPNKAILCVDFSTFSARAVRAAASLLKSPAELHLVHAVAGLEFVPTTSGDWHPEHIRQLEERLEEFGASLDLDEGCALRTRVLEGEPSHEILAYAEEIGADLIVAGSHGHSFMGRLLMGSVSTRLVRGARCAILVAPPEEPAEEVAAPATDEPSGIHPWTQLLRGFTSRNLGRKTEVEVVHPEFGVQHSGMGLPLWGAVYDPRANRVEIMLGQQGSTERHLTHSIPKPVDVEFEGGGDEPETLLVRTVDGEVLLRVLPD